MNLSIKNVPRDKLERLRRRAKRNHRSLQGELMALIDQAVAKEPEVITLDELAEAGRRRGLRTPDEATRWIRQDRGRR